MQEHYRNVYLREYGGQSIGDYEHWTVKEAIQAAHGVNIFTFGKIKCIGRWRVIPKQKVK